MRPLAPPATRDPTLSPARRPRKHFLISKAFSDTGRTAGLSKKGLSALRLPPFSVRPEPHAIWYGFFEPLSLSQNPWDLTRRTARARYQRLSIVAFLGWRSPRLETARLLRTASSLIRKGDFFPGLVSPGRGADTRW